jgi:hypothetical protein
LERGKIMACGYCKETGHNKKTCPKRKADLLAEAQSRRESSSSPSPPQPAPENWDDSTPLVNPTINLEFGDLGESGYEKSRVQEWTDTAVEKASEFGKKVVDTLGSGPKIDLEHFIRLHMMFNDVACDFKMWFTSVDLVDLSNEYNFDGKAVKWKTDPRLKWYRDHYKFWNLVYPEMLQWINAEKIYFPLVFAWETGRLAIAKYELYHAQKKKEEDEAKGKIKIEGGGQSGNSGISKNIEGSGNEENDQSV